ncbi:MAG: hypothetical protein ACOCVF_00020 [bacterium]
MSKEQNTSETHQDHTPLAGVSGSTESKPKTLLECSVCWGGGEIDINDDMQTVKCWKCGGTGVLKNY